MAIIFGQRCFACIFSIEIFGKKIVKNIPIASTKTGWKESVNRTSDTGECKVTLTFRPTTFYLEQRCQADVNQFSLQK